MSLSYLWANKPKQVPFYCAHKVQQTSKTWAKCNNITFTVSEVMNNWPLIMFVTNDWALCEWFAFYKDKMVQKKKKTFSSRYFQLLNHISVVTWKGIARRCLLWRHLVLACTTLKPKNSNARWELSWIMPVMADMYGRSLLALGIWFHSCS